MSFTERDDHVAVRLLRGSERAEAERHPHVAVLLGNHDVIQSSRRHQPETHRRPPREAARGSQNTGEKRSTLDSPDGSLFYVP